MAETADPLEDLLDEKWDKEEVEKSEQKTPPRTPPRTPPKVHLSERLEVVYSRSLGDFESLNVETTASFNSLEESTVRSHESEDSHESLLQEADVSLDSETIATMLSDDAKLVRMEDGMMNILNKMQCAQIDAVQDKVLDMEHGIKDKLANVEKSLREKNLLNDEMRRRLSTIECAMVEDADDDFVDIVSNGELFSDEDSATLNTSGSASASSGTAGSAEGSSGSAGDDSAEVEALVEELEVNFVRSASSNASRSKGLPIEKSEETPNESLKGSPIRSQKGSQWFKKLKGRAPTPPLLKKAHSKSKESNDDKPVVSSSSEPSTPVRQKGDEKTSPPRLKTSPKDTNKGKRRVPPKPTSNVNNEKEGHAKPSSVPRLPKPEQETNSTLKQKEATTIEKMESIVKQSGSQGLTTISETEDSEEEITQVVAQPSKAPGAVKEMAPAPTLVVTQPSPVEEKEITDKPTSEPSPTNEPTSAPPQNPVQLAMLGEKVLVKPGVEPSLVREPTPTPMLDEEENREMSRVALYGNHGEDFQSEINAAILASESTIGTLLAVEKSARDDKNEKRQSRKELTDDGTVLSSMEYPLGAFDEEKKVNGKARADVLPTVIQEADDDDSLLEEGKPVTEAKDQMDVVKSRSNLPDDGTVLSSTEYPLGAFDEGKKENDAARTRVLLAVTEEADGDVSGHENTGPTAEAKETGETDVLGPLADIVAADLALDKVSVTSHDEGTESPHLENLESVKTPPADEDEVEDYVPGIEYTLSDLEENTAAVAAEAEAEATTTKPDTVALDDSDIAEKEEVDDDKPEVPQEVQDESAEEMATILPLSRVESDGEESRRKQHPVKLYFPPSCTPVSEHEEEDLGIEYPLSMVENAKYEEASIPPAATEISEDSDSVSPDEPSGEGFECTLESIENDRSTTPDVPVVKSEADEDDAGRLSKQADEGDIEFTIDSIEQFAENEQPISEDKAETEQDEAETEQDEDKDEIEQDEAETEQDEDKDETEQDEAETEQNEDKDETEQDLASKVESSGRKVLSKGSIRKMSLWKKRVKKKGSVESEETTPADANQVDPRPETPTENESDTHAARDLTVHSDELVSGGDEQHAASDPSRDMHESHAEAEDVSPTRKASVRTQKRISSLWKKRSHKRVLTDSEAETAVVETMATPTKMSVDTSTEKTVDEAMSVESKGPEMKTPGASTDESESVDKENLKKDPSVPESPSSVLDIILGMSEEELLNSSAQDALPGESKKSAVETDHPDPTSPASVDTAEHDDAPDETKEESMETAPVAAKKSRSLVPLFKRRSKTANAKSTDKKESAIVRDVDTDTPILSDEKVPPSDAGANGSAVKESPSGHALLQDHQTYAVPESSMYGFVEAASSQLDVIQGKSDTESANPGSHDRSVAPVKISIFDESDASPKKVGSENLGEGNNLESVPIEYIAALVEASSTGPMPWIQPISPDEETEAEPPKSKRSFWKRHKSAKAEHTETEDEDEAEEPLVEEKAEEPESPKDSGVQEPYTSWEAAAAEAADAAAEAAKSASEWVSSALGMSDDNVDEVPAEPRAPGADVEPDEADTTEQPRTPKGLRGRIRSLGRSPSSSSAAKAGRNEDGIPLEDGLKAGNRSLLGRNFGSNLSTTSSRLSGHSSVEEFPRTTGSSSTKKTDNRDRSSLGLRIFSSRRFKRDLASDLEDEGSLAPLLRGDEDHDGGVKLKRRRTKIKLHRKKYTDLMDDDQRKKEVEGEHETKETRVATPTACYDCSSCLANIPTES